MRKKLFKVGAWILITIGILGTLLMVLTLLSNLAYSMSKHENVFDKYFFCTLFAIVFFTVNIILGINLLKQKQWALFSTMVFTIVAVPLLLWIAFKEQLAPVYDMATVVESILLAIIYGALFSISLVNYMTKN